MKATGDEIQIPNGLKPVFNVLLRVYEKRERFHIKMRYA